MGDLTRDRVIPTIGVNSDCRSQTNVARIDHKVRASSSEHRATLHGRTLATFGTICSVTPLNLTDLELETAARACRALAYQEEQAARRMENPDIRGPIENTAKRAAALAERFEAARRRNSE
jgi:hypothetical protein